MCSSNATHCCTHTHSCSCVVFLVSFCTLTSVVRKSDWANAIILHTINFCTQARRLHSSQTTNSSIGTSQPICRAAQFRLDFIPWLTQFPWSDVNPYMAITFRHWQNKNVQRVSSETRLHVHHLSNGGLEFWLDWGKPLFSCQQQPKFNSFFLFCFCSISLLSSFYSSFSLFGVHSLTLRYNKKLLGMMLKSNESGKRKRNAEKKPNFIANIITLILFI